MGTITSNGFSLATASGSGNFVGDTSPTFTTPTLGAATATSIQFNSSTGILDSNGNALVGTTATASSVNSINIAGGATGNSATISAVGETNIGIRIKAKGTGQLSFVDGNNTFLLVSSTTASAVNYITFTNEATGNAPRFAVSGSDSNITLQIRGKGTGGGQILGQTSGNVVTAGYFGETIASTITAASATAISTATSTNLTSISLTAGVWQITYNVGVTVTTGITDIKGGVSTTTATLPNNEFCARVKPSTSADTETMIACPTIYVNISGTTTYYAVVNATFTGTGTMYGNITGVRIA